MLQVGYWYGYNKSSSESSLRLHLTMPEVSIIAYKIDWAVKTSIVLLNTYMKSSFPKCVKLHSGKWAWNANSKFKGCVLVKTFSHMHTCVYMCIYTLCVYIYIYLWKVLSLNKMSQLCIGIATSIFRLALNAFWKKRSSYAYVTWELNYNDHVIIK